MASAVSGVAERDPKRIVCLIWVENISEPWSDPKSPCSRTLKAGGDV